MIITKKEILKSLKPGDAVLIHHLERSIISDGIALMEDGVVSHVACSVGGLDLVEADIGGISWSNVRNYFTSKYRVIVRRPRGKTNTKRTVKYWISCVGESYDVWMLVGMFFLFVLKKIGLHGIMKHAKNYLASKDKCTCGELFVRGARIGGAEIVKGQVSEVICPQDLLEDKSMITVIDWVAPLYSD